MTMPAMLAAMMGGGALSIPCALCLLAGEEQPNNGATLVDGTLVCAPHAPVAVLAFCNLDAAGLRLLRP